MNKMSVEDNASAYIIPIHKVRCQAKGQRRSRQSSLPSIVFPKDEKVNEVRRKLQETNTAVSIAKARVHALTKEKAKNQDKKVKNLKQIEFLRTVRVRMFNDRQFKESYRNRCLSEVESLHNKANHMRQQMIKQRALARSIVNQQKSDCASSQRLRKRQDQQYIFQMRHLQEDQNRLKAQEIKRSEQEQQAKMRLLQESRLVIAKKNHESRVVSSLKDKHRADRTLKSLMKQQDSLVMSVKQAEQEMMETLYELETLNPELRNRKFRSSRTIQLKH